MVNPALSTTVPLANWLDAVLDVLFINQDDAQFESHYEQIFPPDFNSRINHNSENFAQFRESVKQARNDNILTLQSNNTLQSWDAPDGSGAGCVAQLLHFTLKSKKDGKETKSSSLILANVQVHDGKRVFAELREISK